MGRKWANIVAKKTAKDGANSKVYAKFGVEIYVAAKKGDILVIIHDGIIFVRQTFNIVMNMGRTRSSFDHFLASIRHTKADIVPNRATKEHRILQDNTHTAP